MMRALSNSRPSLVRSTGRESIHSRCALSRELSGIGLPPSGLARVVGSSASLLTGWPGKRSRTRCCWAMMTWAVASATGRRRGRRYCLWVSVDREGGRAILLVVLVDQDRGSVAVAGQAVQRQRADFLGTAAGVHQQLGRDPHLAPVQGVQVGAQLGHDLSGQGPAWVARAPAPG